MKIQNHFRYQGSGLLLVAQLFTALELELEEVVLLIMMGASLPVDNCSTCLPHLGHTTQSASITSPQCLQNFELLILIPSFLCIY